MAVTRGKTIWYAHSEINRDLAWPTRIYDRWKPDHPEENLTEDDVKPDDIDGLAYN